VTKFAGKSFGMVQTDVSLTQGGGNVALKIMSSYMRKRQGLCIDRSWIL